jgi:hypothetical protein
MNSPPIGSAFQLLARPGPAHFSTHVRIRRQSRLPFVFLPGRGGGGALGDVTRAAPYLAELVDQSLFTSRPVLPLDPWWDKIRGSPEFQALLQAPKANK